MIKTTLMTFAVLLSAACAWVLLLPADGQVGRAKPAATPASASSDPQPTSAPQTVRVVYPGPGASDANTEYGARVDRANPATRVDAPSPSSVALGPAKPADAGGPAVGEPEAVGDAGPAVAAPPAAPGQVVDINNATVEAMDHLPGAGRIGLAIARHRPYRSVEDLLTKRVVRRSVYEKIRMQLAAQ